MTNANTPDTISIVTGPGSPELKDQQAVERRVRELLHQKSSLSEVKLEIQGKLTALKNQCLIRLPGEKYRAIQQERKKLIVRLGDLEKQMVAIRTELRQLSPTIPGTNAMSPSIVEITNALSDLRDRWSETASDDTIESSGRLMASKIVRDLTLLLKKFCVR